MAHALYTERSLGGLSGYCGRSTNRDSQALGEGECKEGEQTTSLSSVLSELSPSGNVGSERGD